MKNGRTISIKDPKLQRVRNNLRLIILEECSRRKSEIWDQEHDINHDKDGNYVRTSEEGSKILQELTNKWWEIERPLRASIVKCPGCKKHNKDMTFHRKSKSWDRVIFFNLTLFFKKFKYGKSNRRDLPYLVKLTINSAIL